MTENHRNVPQGINYELQYTEKIMPMLVFNGYYHHFNGSRDTIEGRLYNADSDFRFQCQMLPAISALPPERTCSAICDLREYYEHSKFSSELSKLMDYFESTYVGRITGVNVTATGTTIRITGVDVTAEGTKIRRKAPLFEKAIWNINAMILSEQPKTSNSIESFNKQLAKCIGHSHPSIYRLIPEIGAEILWAESKIGAYLAGGKFPRRNGRYVEVQKRLRNAVIRNTEVKSNNISFLKAIAMNLGRVDHSKNNKPVIKAEEAEDLSGKIPQPRTRSSSVPPRKDRRSDPNSPEIQCMTKLNVVRRVLKLDMLDDDFLHQICIKHGYNQEKRAYEASFKYFSSTEAKPSRTWCVFGDGNCILRWGSTLHLIAASKLYKIVILTYSQLESGLPSWTVHNPSMQTGTAPSMEQELVYPSVAFQIEANHCDVVLDVEPPL